MALRRRLLLAAVPVMLAAAGPGAAPALAASIGISSPEKAGMSRARLARITAYFNNEVANRKIAGAVVQVFRRGRMAYYETFGVRDEKTGAPMTPDTIFRLSSMSKTITSVAAMTLVEEGRLPLDMELAKFIPSFANVKVAAERTDTEAQSESGPELLPLKRGILIQDLLRHTSGITYTWLAYGAFAKSYQQARLDAGEFDNAEFAERVAKLPLAHQPGTKWVYGHSTDILGRVIEVVSGKTLYQFEKERVLDPLGMTSTGFFVTDPARQAFIAEPLSTDDGLDRNPRIVKKWESGGGGMVSTPDDYGRFARMLLQRGTFEGKQILGSRTVAMMTSDQIGPGSGVTPWAYYFPGSGYGYGYGFAVRITPGVSPWPGSLGQFEWSGGTGTYVSVDPKEDMYVLLMMQTQKERGRIQSALKYMVYGAIEN